MATLDVGNVNIIIDCSIYVMHYYVIKCTFSMYLLHVDY